MNHFSFDICIGVCEEGKTFREKINIKITCFFISKTKIVEIFPSKKHRMRWYVQFMLNHEHIIDVWSQWSVKWNFLNSLDSDFEDFILPKERYFQQVFTIKIKWK
jgi:hypothetical protein